MHTTCKSAFMKLHMSEALEEAIDKKLIDAIITYTSSNEKVAIVSTSGKITAKGKGKTTITATLILGETKVIFKKAVTVQNAYIQIVQSINSKKVGDSFSFTVKVYGYKESDVTFATTKKSIVLISSTTGKARAITKGTDYVVITFKKITKKIKVSVK